ncbi:MAG: hypothetical protein ABSC06_26655 [Rhodopila sp.]|jgi:hypothetical protein
MFHRIAAVGAIMLAGWTTAAAADGGLSVVLTSVKGTRAGGSQTCSISAEVNNDTANHVDQLTANATMFNIRIKNLRAYARYEFTFDAQTSCNQVVAYIQSHPDFASIDRCDMPGVREGDCLREINITSIISLTQAARADAAANAAEAAAKARADEYRTLALDRSRAYVRAEIACTKGMDTCRKQSWENARARGTFTILGVPPDIQRCSVDCTRPPEFPDGAPPLPPGSR